MKIIILKKSIIISTIIFFIVSSFFIVFFKFFQSREVYKDRDFWEKTGNIVWEVNTENKLVALTFDDGPSPTYTEKILDLLAMYDAHATFFVIGSQAEKYPEIIKREVKEGHELGNHTYKHQEVNQTSEEDLIKDLKQAHQVIRQITGQEMKVFRPTSGYYDGTIVAAAKSLDYTVIIWTWNQDSRDWTQQDGISIAHRLTRIINPGSIILFHDQGGNRSNTIKALHVLLPVLAEKGYRFVTVSTLLKLRQDARNVIK